MKLFLHLICLSLLLPLLANSKNLALLIGIGDYPSESGWSKIHGDKDLDLIEPILSNHSFDSANIIKLKNGQATKQAIERSFNILISQAKKSDNIYIHYSGHGQRVTDLNGDETDGYDEAWVAYDARIKYETGTYEGENHVIDDSLNTWLSRLRTVVGNGSKISVVVDACYSGDGTKSLDDNYLVRGTSETFVIPGNHEPYSNLKTNNIDWIYISATSSRHPCYETKDGYGGLTSAIHNYSDKLSSEPCSSLLLKFENYIQKRIPFRQKPTLVTPVGRRNDTLLP